MNITLIIEYNNSIYIKNKIFLKENNITIEPKKNEPKKNFNSADNNSIAINARFFYHNGFRLFKNKNKLNLYKKYILCNLPKVLTHPNELYIYKVIYLVIQIKHISTLYYKI